MLGLSRLIFLNILQTNKNYNFGGGPYWLGPYWLEARAMAPCSPLYPALFQNIMSNDNVQFKRIYAAARNFQVIIILLLMLQELK